MTLSASLELILDQAHGLNLLDGTFCGEVNPGRKERSVMALGWLSILEELEPLQPNQKNQEVKNLI